MQNGSSTDRMFHIILQVVTTGVAVIGMILGFTDRINSLATDLKQELTTIKVYNSEQSSKLNSMQKDLDEHQIMSLKMAEQRANYHHTSANLSCALCKNIAPVEQHKTRYGTEPVK